MRALAIFLALTCAAIPAQAAQQQRDDWPSVSRNQSRVQQPPPKHERRVTANFCQDLCYCWTDPKVTIVEQSACVYNSTESRYECTSLMFYACAKRTAVDGRVTCKTCM